MLGLASALNYVADLFLPCICGLQLISAFQLFHSQSSVGTLEQMEACSCLAPDLNSSMEQIVSLEAVYTWMLLYNSLSNHLACRAFAASKQMLIMMAVQAGISRSLTIGSEV